MIEDILELRDDTTESNKNCLNCECDHSFHPRKSQSCNHLKTTCWLISWHLYYLKNIMVLLLLITSLPCNLITPASRSTLLTLLFVFSSHATTVTILTFGFFGSNWNRHILAKTKKGLGSRKNQKVEVQRRGRGVRRVGGRVEWLVQLQTSGRRGPCLSHTQESWNPRGEHHHHDVRRRGQQSTVSFRRDNVPLSQNL